MDQNEIFETEWAKHIARNEKRFEKIYPTKFSRWLFTSSANRKGTLQFELQKSLAGLFFARGMLAYQKQILKEPNKKHGN